MRSGAVLLEYNIHVLPVVLYSQGDPKVERGLLLA